MKQDSTEQMQNQAAAIIAALEKVGHPFRPGQHWPPRQVIITGEQREACGQTGFKLGRHLGYLFVATLDAAGELDCSWYHPDEIRHANGRYRSDRGARRRARVGSSA